MRAAIIGAPLDLGAGGGASIWVRRQSGTRGWRSGSPRCAWIASTGGTSRPPWRTRPPSTTGAHVAAVVDVYDAITSQRPYAAAQPAHVGVRVISEGEGRAFDPAVVGVFRRIVMPYPVGTEIRLPDGRLGVVAAADADRPHAPLVRVDGSELRLDLSDAAAA